jgi:predicted phage terminase large subunit-like protein
MSAEPTSDFSVGTTWGLQRGRWFLIDRVRARLDFPDLKRRISREADRWQADIVLIEHAASGIPLLQQLRHDSNQGWRFMPMQPRQEKSLRVEAQTARMETGRYLLPANAHWLEELRRELTAFPNGRNDDQVDSMVQFIEWSGSARLHSLVPRDPATGRLLRNPRPARIDRPQRPHFSLQR